MDISIFLNKFKSCFRAYFLQAFIIIRAHTDCNIYKLLSVDPESSKSFFQFDYFGFNINVSILSRELALSCDSKVPDNHWSSEKEGIIVLGSDAVSILLESHVCSLRFPFAGGLNKGNSHNAKKIFRIFNNLQVHLRRGLSMLVSSFKIPLRLCTLPFFPCRFPYFFSPVQGF